jgi:APA family basic amino acid/polyamine antiporter
LTEADSPDPERRRLGVVSAAAIVVANMIGVGVFTTSGFAIADLGRREPVLLAWLIGGLLAVCGALCYGALARRIPISGGEYTFLSRTVHPLAGFLAGWVSLLAGFTAPIAASGLGLGVYVAPLLPGDVSGAWLATFAIAAAAAMHGLRLREGVLAQNVAVGLKLALITAFLAFAAPRLPDDVVVEPLFAGGLDPTAFAITLVWISFAYSGWNAAVYVAGEVRDPERNLPRALLLGTGVVLAIYLALNAVFLYAVPVSAIAGRPEVAAIAASALGGEPLERAVSLLIALALFTSVSSMVMIGPRVYAQMAEDGLLPRLFASRSEVPAAAILFQSALSVLVVWVSGLEQLLSYIGFTLGLSAAATVFGLLRLRAREGAAAVPVPGYPWVPGFYLAMTLWATIFMAWRAPAEAGMGLLTAAAGLPLYWLMRRRSALE